MHLGHEAFVSVRKPYSFACLPLIRSQARRSASSTADDGAIFTSRPRSCQAAMKPWRRSGFRWRMRSPDASNRIWRTVRSRSGFQIYLKRFKTVWDCLGATPAEFQGKAGVHFIVSASPAAMNGNNIIYLIFDRRYECAWKGRERQCRQKAIILGNCCRRYS
jgi:hypothetical protein